jgi:glycosyl transferase family 25
MYTAFEQLNFYFDQVYVLTLERAHERQAAIRQALEGLQYRFFYSADKQTLDIPALVASGQYDETAARRNHRYSQPMQPGQLGCAIGHRMIYEDILQQGYQRVLILEDDVEPDFTSDILPATILDELPDDWDLLYFDYDKNLFPRPIKQAWYHVQHAMGLLKWSHSMIRHLYPHPFSAHLSRAGFHDYTSAYALTARGARVLLQLQSPLSYVADNLLATAATSGQVKAFISQPRLFRQRSQGSGASESSMVKG